MKQFIFIFLLLSMALSANEDFGQLVFQDDFERSESQEEKDEPGNDWTTSSDKTAYGEKQVDLRDGYMHIYTHEKAWHATSVRHAFQFKDGTVELKVKFYDPQDSIKLNFTDLGEKSVHAGHLFNVEVSPVSVKLTDLKTGVMNLDIQKAKKSKTLSEAQAKTLATKSKSFKNELEIGKWHTLTAKVEGDVVSCSINGVFIGSFASSGIAHETKTLLRLLVPHKVSIDEIRIWCKK
jgi:uncharacterized protein (DUF952 family)